MLCVNARICFLNLDENAVNPLDLPEKPYGLEIDYMDVNNDDKLESVTYFGDDKNPQK